MTYSEPHRHRFYVCSFVQIFMHDAALKAKRHHVQLRCTTHDTVSANLRTAQVVVSRAITACNMLQ